MKPNYEKQRAAAYELYLQGKKYQEIADAVGVTLSAIFVPSFVGLYPEGSVKRMPEQEIWKESGCIRNCFRIE